MRSLKIVFSVLFSITIAAQLTAQTKIGTPFFDRADAFFQKNVKKGLIDYSQLGNDKILAELVKEITGANSKDLNDLELQAFFATV